MRSSMIAIAVLLGSLAVTSAEAMPVPAVGTTASVPVVKVDYTCGRGRHVTRWGDCRPNRWGPPPRRWGYYRPPPPPPWGWRDHRRHWRDDGWRDRPRYW
ncbi:GCG_CRPN prefix-to-repeats domain-containing protein [Rhizobium lusitanum]|uniref:GCG_CRPN prefix-to-repeats domain-containing protein n=1 Tax=Rhizobium lusitanum TaxID=293958 RepID=UPI003D7C3631